MAVLRTFLTDLLPVARVVWVGADVHEAAVAALLAAGRPDVSLVDWVSFELLRRSGRRRVFAFDEGFVRAGLEVEGAVPPPNDARRPADSGF
jgi:predicted nucleic acid-binding protein